MVSDYPAVGLQAADPETNPEHQWRNQNSY